MENKQLTTRENDYLRLMQARYLVLNLVGAPGIAKSAIAASIAEKMGYVFIDLRLATMDETDLGVYPTIRNVTDDKGNVIYPILDHAVPRWAEMTRDNTKTFLIAFEELNRASKSVRDAALGILLERKIGYNFKFGKNVLMVATGNLGTTDGTEVEELDTALKSRLITVEHQMELDEWISSYAKENVHKDVVKYLQAFPTHFYPDIKKQDADGKTIVNPRTWTGLSTYMIEHFGKDSNVEQYGSDLDRQARHYIGSSLAIQFMKWLRDHSRVTAKTVLAGKVKDYKSIERENLAEILTDLKTITIAKIKEKEIPHVITLLRSMDDDVMYGGVWDLVKTDDDNTNKTTAIFIKEFRKEIDIMAKRHQEAQTKGEKNEKK
jgi:hypothetical protein